MAFAIHLRHRNHRGSRAAVAAFALAFGMMAATPMALAQDAVPEPDAVIGPEIGPALDEVAPPEEIQVIGSDPSAVVATVGGKTITERDLVVMANLIGSDTLSQYPVEVWRNILIDQAVATMLVVNSAEELGLDQDEEFLASLEDYRAQALQQQYFDQIIGPSVTDDDIRAEYELRVSQLELPLEVTPRVIVVETEIEANNVLQRINNGEEFEALAAEVSLDPSAAENGGLIGRYITQEDLLVQELADVAFDIDPGVYPVPILVQGFWYVLKVDERRLRPPPPYEQAVIDSLRQQLVNQAFLETVDALRDAADVQILAEQPDSNPAPADEAPADVVPADEAPADEAPADEAPADETPADQLGVDPDGAEAPPAE